MKETKKISMLKKKIYQLIGEYYELTHSECTSLSEKKEIIVIEHGLEPFLIVFTEK